MKNAELWEQYAGYTQTVTETARKLGFAVVAVCWLFREPGGGFPQRIRAVLLLTVLYFLCDFLQFFLGAMFLRCWLRGQERAKHKHKGTIDGEYLKPVWVESPMFIMWLLKIAWLLGAFVYMGMDLLAPTLTDSQGG